MRSEPSRTSLCGGLILQVSFLELDFGALRDTEKKCFLVALDCFVPRPCFLWIGLFLSHTAAIQSLGSNGPAYAASLGGGWRRERERKFEREISTYISHPRRASSDACWRANRAACSLVNFGPPDTEAAAAKPIPAPSGGRRGGVGVPGSLSRNIQWEIRCDALSSAFVYWCELARPSHGLSSVSGNGVQVCS